VKPALAFGLVLGAYLLGSVSPSVLIVRLLQGLDVRTVGSGNAGATNVLRAAGKGPALLALALDIAKGVAAVVAARLLAAPPAVVGAAAVAVVLGHVFPVFFGLRGGKGVATAAGALGALSPWAMLMGLAVFSVVVVWKRYVSLGSVITAATFPAWIHLAHRLGLGGPGDREGGGWLMLAAAAIALLVVLKHIPNLKRLRAGRELRLGRPLSNPSPSPTTAQREDR
jgi:glycerol-3-phosphate acyltransferase PlsY